MAETSQTLKEIQKNIDLIKRRNDKSEKLRHTHESILTMRPIAEPQDIREIKDELRAIKQGLAGQQSKSDPELKAALNALNSKVDAIQQWVNEFAVGDAVEMSEFREGLSAVDERVLDSAPLLDRLISEVGEIREGERAMRDELSRIEQEIRGHREQMGLQSPFAPKKAAKKAAPKIKAPEPKARKEKPAKKPKAVKPSSPPKKQGKAPMRNVIPLGKGGEKPDKQKLKKFMDALNSM